MHKLLNIKNHIQLYDAITDFAVYDSIKLYRVNIPGFTHVLQTHTWHQSKVKDSYVVADIDFEVCKIMLRDCTMYFSFYYDYYDMSYENDSALYDLAYPYHHAIQIGSKWVGIDIEGYEVPFIELEMPLKLHDAREINV